MIMLVSDFSEQVVARLSYDYHLSFWDMYDHGNKRVCLYAYSCLLYVAIKIGILTDV